MCGSGKNFEVLLQKLGASEEVTRECKGSRKCGGAINCPLLGKSSQKRLSAEAASLAVLKTSSTPEF